MTATGLHHAERRRRRLVERFHVALDHRPHQRIDFLGRTIRARHHAAAAQHGDSVGRLFDFGKLVGHQHDGTAAFGDTPTNLKERRDLVRQQHRRRFVEQKQTRLADQAFDDLDPLPLADGKVFDLGVGIEGKTVIVRQTFQPSRPSFGVHEAALLAEDDVVDHGHVVHQTEMLVHHGNAACQRIRGARRLVTFAVKAHGAVVRHMHAEDQIAQR